MRYDELHIEIMQNHCDDIIEAMDSKAAGKKATDVKPKDHKRLREKMLQAIHIYFNH